MLIDKYNKNVVLYIVSLVESQCFRETFTSHPWRFFLSIKH